MAFTGNRQLATGNCPLLCCSANVGSFTLDCQIPGAGHARLVLWAADDGLCCPAGSYALHAQGCVRAPGATGDAMPSCDGTVEAAPALIISSHIISSQIFRSIVSGHR